MTSRLWDKGGAADAAMLRYTSRDDWRLDQRLLAYDLVATRAHVRGLRRIGVLTDDELFVMDGALDELVEKNGAGQLVLTEADEDGHTAIEAALVAKLGDVGKKVHTGRSRNDQVLVALRLYERDALSDLARLTTDAARALLSLARREERTPMPGYTHLQRAVPSSVGLWAASFAENLLDAVDLVRATAAIVDRSPLGAAAGYGVNLALDREGVARELGFSGVAWNPLGSQTSRGILEAQVLSAAWGALAVVRRLAWDLSLFTTSEFGFVRLPEAFTTGSSIMPQKRNPDVVELMRAACAVVQGALVEVQTMVALPSGYHRDLQLTKAPLLRGLDEALTTMRLVPRLVDGLDFDRERMLSAITPECFATDRAVELAASGVPFREAYRRVAAELETLERGDAAGSLAARVSPGAPGDLRLRELEARLAALT
ncbi:argininosuccinate lyase [Polyangium aurulentum]|uniref:argininosuccinate lyase n=1 Tax=Polyangium aurulentum TaxID=2567896 RepID=UPI0010AEBBEE|nr:argininosuccinate lyase [Polyangium aurulentum]UQA55200.1 argininosuccinate lyase [Polyangium aurulentum]